MRLYVALALTSIFVGPQLAVADTPATAPLVPVASTTPAYVEPSSCGLVSSGSRVAGCCEHRNHCNDNAWDGYCQEKACCDAIWARIGTGTLLSGCAKPCAACKTCGCASRPLCAKHVKAADNCSCVAAKCSLAPLAPCCEP